MSLQSRLFRGDAALEACLVNDRAHVVEGARGPHVPKIQRALGVLDGALIDVAEVAGELYGGTTAKAVLDYKRARKIINFSYQAQADNIVGKMTIASLDREMAVNENRPPLRGCLNELIFMEFDSSENKTTTAYSAGAATGANGFPNFVIVNPEIVHPDRGTLLHEMIHTSNDKFMNDLHDTDKTHVLSTGDNRTVLTQEHVESLRKAFFSTGK